MNGGASDFAAVTPLHPDYFSTLIEFERDSLPTGAAQLVHAPTFDRLSAGTARPSIDSAPVGGEGCAGDSSPVCIAEAS